MLAVGVTVLVTAVAGCANKEVAAPPAPLVVTPPTTTTAGPQGPGTGLPAPATASATITNKVGAQGGGGPGGSGGVVPGSLKNCPSGHPTPVCVGVPSSVAMATVGGDLEVKSANTVIDGKHITGNLHVVAPGAVVRNSQIDDTVVVEDGGSLTIYDSTVGPAKCGTNTWYAAAMGVGHYTAQRVHIRGHEDGFNAGEPDIVVKDSYIELCNGNASAHSDGIQDYPAANRLVVDHNTFNACGSWPTDRGQPACNVDSNYPGSNGPIFIYSQQARGGGSTDVTVTNNLAIGGINSIWLEPDFGTWIVTGNKVVDGTWKLAPYETNTHCSQVKNWSDNTVVTMDTNWMVTGTVRTVPCPA
jgi:hypothetical protein